MQLVDANRNFVTAFLVQHDALIKQELTEQYPAFVQSLQSHLLHIVDFQETQSDQILKVLQRKDERIQQLEARLRHATTVNCSKETPQTLATSNGQKNASTQVTFEQQIVEQLNQRIHQQSQQIDVLLDEIQQLRAQLAAASTAADSSAGRNENHVDGAAATQSVLTQTDVTTGQRQAISLHATANHVESNEIKSLEQQISQIESQSAQLKRFLTKNGVQQHADDVISYDQAEKWLVDAIHGMETSSQCNLFGVMSHESCEHCATGQSDCSCSSSSSSAAAISCCLELRHQLHVQTLQSELLQEEILSLRIQLAQEQIVRRDQFTSALTPPPDNSVHRREDQGCAHMLKSILSRLRKTRRWPCVCSESAEKTRPRQWKQLIEAITKCHTSEQADSLKRVARLVREWAGWEQSHVQELRNMKQQQHVKMALLQSQNDAMRCEMHQLHQQLIHHKAQNNLLKRQLDAELTRQRPSDDALDTLHASASDSVGQQPLPQLADLLLHVQVLENALLRKNDQLHASDAVIQALTCEHLVEPQVKAATNAQACAASTTTTTTTTTTAAAAAATASPCDATADPPIDEQPTSQVKSPNGAQKTLCDLLKQLELVRAQLDASERRAERNLLQVSKQFELECLVSKLGSDLTSEKRTREWLEQQNSQLHEELHQATQSIAKFERQQSFMMHENDASLSSIWNSYNSLEEVRKAGMVCSLQLQASERHRCDLHQELRTLRSFVAMSTTQSRLPNPLEPWKRVQDALDKLAFSCQNASSDEHLTAVAHAHPQSSKANEMHETWKAKFEALGKKHDVLWKAFDHLHRLYQLALGPATGSNDLWGSLDGKSTDKLVAFVRTRASSHEHSMLVFQLTQRLEKYMEVNRLLEQSLAEKAIELHGNTTTPWTNSKETVAAATKAVLYTEDRAAQTDTSAIDQHRKSTQTSHADLCIRSTTRNRRVQVDLHAPPSQSRDKLLQPLQPRKLRPTSDSLTRNKKQQERHEESSMDTKVHEMKRKIQVLTASKEKLQNTVESYARTIQTLQKQLETPEELQQQQSDAKQALNSRDKELKQTILLLEHREQENLQLKQQLVASEGRYKSCQTRFDDEMKRYVDQINAKLGELEQAKAQVCEENDTIRQELAQASQWLQHKRQNEQSQAIQTCVTMQDLTVMTLEESASHEKALARANARLVDLQKQQKRADQDAKRLQSHWQRLDQEHEQLQHQFVKYQQAVQQSKEESNNRIEFLAASVRECAQIVVQCQHTLNGLLTSPGNGCTGSTKTVNNNKVRALEEDFVDDLYDMIIRLSHEFCKRPQRPPPSPGGSARAPRVRARRGKRASLGRGRTRVRTLFGKVVRSRHLQRNSFIKPMLQSPVPAISSAQGGADSLPAIRQVTHWQVRNATLQERLDAARLKIASHEETIAKLQQAHHQLNHELERADETEELASSQCLVLKNEFATLKTQFNLLSKKCSDATKQQTDVAKKLETQLQENTRLKLALQRKSELLLGHKVTVEELTNELQNVEQRLDFAADKDKTCHQLQQRVNHQFQALEALRNQLVQMELAKIQLQETNNKQREEVAVLHARIKALRRENTKLRAKDKNKETTMTPSTNVNAPADLQVASGAPNAPQEASANPPQIKASCSVCGVLEDQTKQLKHRLIQKTQLITSLKEQIAAKLDQIDAKTRQVTRLTQQNQTLKDKMSQLEVSIQHMKDEQGVERHQLEQHHHREALTQERLRREQQARLDGLRASVYDAFEAFLVCNQPPPSKTAPSYSQQTSPASSSSYFSPSSSPASHARRCSSPSLLGIRALQMDRVQEVAKLADFSTQELEELMETCHSRRDRKSEVNKQSQNQSTHDTKDWQVRLNRLEMALEDRPQDCRNAICDCLVFITTRRFQRAFAYNNADAYCAMEDSSLDDF